MSRKLIENLTALGRPQDDPHSTNPRNASNLLDKNTNTENAAIVGGSLQLRFFTIHIILNTAKVFVVVILSVGYAGAAAHLGRQTHPSKGRTLCGIHGYCKTSGLRRDYLMGSGFTRSEIFMAAVIFWQPCFAKSTWIVHCTHPVARSWFLLATTLAGDRPREKCWISCSDANEPKKLFFSRAIMRPSFISF